jgi:Rieske 2Fe-2S family protein
MTSLRSFVQDRGETMLSSEAISPAAFLATRAELADARHLPGYVYTSERVQEVEKDKIFMREWLCLGRVEELAKPGDYLAVRIMDEPVLVVRNKEGILHGFANVCRHRGVEVAPVGQGSASEFLCPYHSWAYDLDGKLIGAPLMRGWTTADLTGCRLPTLKLTEWRGWIFINFDLSARPFAEIIRPFEEQFGFLQPENCVLADKTVLELNCNWKFVVENLMDVYHIGTVHGRSFGAYYKGDRERYAFTLLPRGGYSFFFEAGPVTTDGKSHFGKMPWLDRSETMACLGFLAPNVNFSARCDSIRHWLTWPISPGKSQLISYTLVAKDVPQRSDFKGNLPYYVDALKMAIDEDREMVESLQNGVRSRQFEPGPLAKLEGPIHHVMNNYLDQLTA